ncbi:MAG: carboxypeptidase-like regulatory domain-containing protein, partial [Lewinella sp.]
LLACLLAGNPIYALPGNNDFSASNIADQRQLLEVIKEMEERYQVFFTYERALLEDVEVHFDFREEESLEDAVARLLTETGFLYRTFGDKYLVIYRDDKAGRIGARKLGKAIKQLQQLESGSSISVQRSQGDPARQFQSVARGIVDAKQALAVSGRVTSSTGETLIGATILVKGTSTGTVTDIDGDYTLADIGESDTLIFSSIGFLTAEIPVNGRTTIDVMLEENVAALDEVVVIGYGTQKKSDITGSVSSVPTDRLENLPVPNILQAIQGTTAGLQVSQGSSVPGSSANLQVRGINSINAGNSPFIVLDGVPFFGQTNDINPNDVASIRNPEGCLGRSDLRYPWCQRGNPDYYQAR